jgi:hypothetical protein
MARLMKYPSLRAAIVCADTLTRSDHDFFKFARRHRPDVPIFAYSATHDGDALDTAVRGGATPLDMDVFHDLLIRIESASPREPRAEYAKAHGAEALPGEAKQPHPGESRQRVVAQASRPHREVVTGYSIAEELEALDRMWEQELEPTGPFAFHPADLDNEEAEDSPAVSEIQPCDSTDDENVDAELPMAEDATSRQSEPAADESDDGDESDPHADEVPSGPVRVPWIRYDNQPQRRKPPTFEPADPHAETTQSRNGEKPKTGEPGGEDTQRERSRYRDDAHEAQPHREIPSEYYEPLLSEEELQALMGDDELDSADSERSALLEEEEQSQARRPDHP